MNVLLTLVGALGLVAVTLVGIVGSGLLAAKRMAEMNDPLSKPDPTGRKTKS